MGCGRYGVEGLPGELARVIMSESLGIVLTISMLGLLGLGSFVRMTLAARKRRAHYQSGQRGLVEAAVQEELASGQGPAQLRILALASLGEFAGARRALLSKPGDAEERRELQLCAQVLVESFEGEKERALALCRELMGVPLCCRGARGRRRRARREATVAVARAVGGVADAGDYEALLRASTFEPTMYWACRYGAAVACWAKREHELVSLLVKDAPPWPEESAFRRLHARLAVPPMARAGLDLARVA